MTDRPIDEGGVRRDAPEEPRAPVPQLVAHLFRRSAGALVASLTRRFGIHRLTLAEDAVQDAMLEALRRWPFEGIPREPAAWLQTVAWRKALDVIRRAGTQQRIEETLRAGSRRVRGPAREDSTTERSTREDEPIDDGTVDDAVVSDAAVGGGKAWGPPHQGAAMWLDEPFPLQDDVLGMLFACCTPDLGRATAIALTLTVVARFSAHEAAAAFLVSEATMGQRMVRAKRRLRESGAPVAIPTEPAELAARRSQVLEVVYLMFNEGYMASDGDALMREQMCGEAARLAVLLAEHAVTTTPEAHALAALLLFQLARLPARAAADGGPILLSAQDRSAWNPSLIAAGFHHLSRAAVGERLSSFHLQAEIASRHVMAERFETTNWPAILSAYDALLELEPTVVVRVNRAVAVGQVHGVAAALSALAEASRDPASAGYRWFYSVRGHFREAAGDTHGASDDLRRAASLTRSSPTRRWLEERHAALLDSSP
jgi:RNA polymerase sigma-70 factor (ECF subfamily)